MSEVHARTIDALNRADEAVLAAAAEIKAKTEFAAEVAEAVRKANGGTNG